jgi:hypothetical protein
VQARAHARACTEQGVSRFLVTTGPVAEGRHVRLLTTAFPTGVSFIDHEFAAGPAGPV